MILTITGFQEIETIEEAQRIFNLIKVKLSSHPELTLHGSVSQRFEELNGDEPD